MTKRMLIDATHAEETRVVVLDGNRLEDFDVETSTKRQLKGNIYLAKVVRVEPSLQAAFVEYGGNRHGFLAFSEIHPDYYQIPVADRQRLIEQEAEEAQREEEEVDRELGGGPAPSTQAEPPPALTPVETGDESGATVAMLHPELPEAERQEPAPEAAAAMTEAGGSTTEFSPAGQTGAAQDNAGPAKSAEPVDAAMPRAEDPVAQATLPVDEEPAPAPASTSETGVASGTGTAAVAPVPEGAEPATPPELSSDAVATAAPARIAVEPAEVVQTEPHAIVPEAGNAATESEHAAAAPEPPQGSGADQAAPEPEDEPHSPSRRAQPLIIEPDTLSGPVETGPAPDEADRFTASDEAGEADTENDNGDYYADVIPESPPPETVGGEPDGGDEPRERRPPSRYLRNYKIQEVIRRRQILLVQVVKEERGTKGAALTTYLSLAGRFSVLMPNSPRGGGISRKITSATDRRRLKEVVAELEMPKGMGLIVRTAGANRPKPEIKRDCEYLLRLWDDIREHTLKSVAPALIYEEASLIKRAIRDVYSRDIDEIQVDGEDGWRAAHEFMRMLMPSHAKKVQLWRDQSQPLFAKYQVEAQLDGMLQPTVQLRSGGYLVINQAEALVAIDVNSGRSTRERNVEETALRTNLEAADEVARQLRLRDLAGLIVIDFIDMEVKKHNAMVERRIKEALKNDRARIQVGHISHFGLLEMSRQRLRPSLAEASFILCPHCGGTGHVRSTENAAIHVLRGIEDEGSKRRAAEIVVHMGTAIALYILNHKRDRLAEIERRYSMRVTILGDDTQVASQFRVDRVRPQVARDEASVAITPDAPQPTLLAPAPVYEPEPEEEPEAVGADEADEDEDGADESGSDEVRAEGSEGAEEKAERERRRRRRRRRRGGRREEGAAVPVVEPALVDATPPDAMPQDAATEADLAVPEPHIEGVPEHAEPSAEDDARRRRGRRGGRRRRREPGDGEASPFAAPGADQPDLPTVYIGPTPANPFGGQAFDIFDVLEQAEANAVVRQEPGDRMVQQFQPEPAGVATTFDTEIVAAAPEPSASTADAEPVAAPAVAEFPTALPEAAAVVSDNASTPVEPELAAAYAEPAMAPVAPEIVNLGAPEPVATEAVEATPAAPAVTDDDAPPVATPQQEAVEVANETAPEPAIKPIIIGSGDDAVTEKKRGWWRR